MIRRRWQANAAEFQTAAILFPKPLWSCLASRAILHPPLDRDPMPASAPPQTLQENQIPRKPGLPERGTAFRSPRARLARHFSSGALPQQAADLPSGPRHGRKRQPSIQYARSMRRIEVLSQGMAGPPASASFFFAPHCNLPHDQFTHSLRFVYLVYPANRGGPPLNSCQLSLNEANTRFASSRSPEQRR